MPRMIGPELTDRDRPAATRLAPSPTGALHLGNAMSFLITWAIARQRGWLLHMRIEDLDGPRVQTDAARDAIDLLAWMGLDWDGEIMWQSRDLSPYCSAMRTLAQKRCIYSCSLSRNEIAAAASAPQEGDQHETPFPIELRADSSDVHRFRFHDDEDSADHVATNNRFIVEPGAVTIDDQLAGVRTFDPAREIGDFIVWTLRSQPAYQLAVVVDDARQGVTDVIRGNDLLSSAARQVLLYRALGLEPPRWWHLPLVRGSDGRRLAKRHGDTRVTAYREKGVPAERIIGLIAGWCNVDDSPRCMDAAEFCSRFDVRNLPSHDITFSDRDHSWLLCESLPSC